MFSDYNLISLEQIQQKGLKLSQEDICSKCSKEVHPANNALLLAIIADKIRRAGLKGYLKKPEDTWMRMATERHLPKHLFPIVEDGELVCEGSPSRAQYLPGLPRATDQYNNAMEWLVRRAFLVLLMDHGDMDPEDVSYSRDDQSMFMETIGGFDDEPDEKPSTITSLTGRVLALRTGDIETIDDETRRVFDQGEGLFDDEQASRMMDVIEDPDG